MARFIAVPADRLLGLLEGIGQKVEGKGGSFSQSVAGKEIVFDLNLKNGLTVRVFTSVAKGSSVVRDCGKDAVRIVVGRHRGAKFQPLAKSRKILRTAPQNLPDENRIEAFLERFTEALRENYAAGLHHPMCPSCKSPLHTRKNRTTGHEFEGCTMYPECRYTRQVQKSA
jgi:hypothetical protein